MTAQARQSPISGPFEDTSQAQARAGKDFVDHAVVFGEDNHLVGVVSTPETAAIGQRPGVIFVNAGLDHRVGPRGLYVALSRRIAALGFPSIRFDQAGMGESRHPSDPMKTDDDSAAPSDCLAAAERLGEISGCQRFVVCALCSGTHDAHRLAMADTRVVGMILFDGYAYPTARFRRTYYRQRILSIRRWLNLFRAIGRHMMGRSPAGRSGINAADGVTFFELPSRERMARDLQHLAERDVHLFHAYSGGARDEYNYPSQLRDAFADVVLDERLEEHYVPAADHTFSRDSDRRVVFERIERWLGRLFMDDVRS